MNSAATVNDLTTDLPWENFDDWADADAAPLDVAVPSGNFGAEPQRLDATKARITARLIGRYIDGQRRLASLNYSGARQELETISEASTNEKRNGLWNAPVVRSVNWTRANTFTALQEWEGVVLAITSDHILVSLVDLTAGKNRATEEAQIPLSEINDQDLPKLAQGRIFRWAIGYQRLKTGSKKRISNIVFRDLPQWTKDDFTQAGADAARLMRFLGSGQSGAEASGTESSQG
jgi:hypothetical protein